MKITEEMLIHIEKALNITLYGHQRRYLLTDDYMVTGRRNGRTLVHCVKLALSEGDTLDLRKPYEFSDYGNGTKTYAKDHYKRAFLDVWYRLKDYGLPVRGIVQ